MHIVQLAREKLSAADFHPQRILDLNLALTKTDPTNKVNKMMQFQQIRREVHNRIDEAIMEEFLKHLMTEMNQGNLNLWGERKEDNS